MIEALSFISLFLLKNINIFKDFISLRTMKSPFLRWVERWVSGVPPRLGSVIKLREPRDKIALGGSLNCWQIRKSLTVLGIGSQRVSRKVSWFCLQQTG